VTGAQRLIVGRETFSRAITLLLTRNHLSHAQLSAAASWASPETPGWLSTSQISYYRTQHNKILGPKPADALGQLNLALAMLAGDDSEGALAMKHLGKPPRPIATLIEDPFYLRHPATMDPCNAGDLFMIWIGRLIPYELAQGQSLDPTTFSEELSRLCQDWFVSQGLALRDGLRLLLSHYPSNDVERMDRLQQVVAGLSSWDAAQLDQEAEAMASMIGMATTGHRFTVRELMEMMHGRPSSSSKSKGRETGLPENQ
jgi:hypothetical protein